MLMKDDSELRKRAKLAAQKYFIDYENWPTPVVSEEVERLAFQTAWEGDSLKATELFILVAELGLLQPDSDPAWGNLVIQSTGTVYAGDA